MTLHDSAAKLKALSRRWSGSKKKLDLTIISLIHDWVSGEKFSPQALQLLVDSSCFDQCLWKLCHQDVSLNHVELILSVVLFQFNRNLVSEMRTMTESELFDQFMTRMMAIVSEIGDLGAFRVSKLILMFFTALCSCFLQVPKVQQFMGTIFGIAKSGLTANSDAGNTNDPENCSFVSKNTDSKCSQVPSSYLDLTLFSAHKNWINTIISYYTKDTFAQKKVDKIEFQQFLEQFLRLLIVGLSQDDLKRQFKPWFETTLFPFYIRTIDPSRFVQVSIISKLNDFLILCLLSSDDQVSRDERFNQLQYTLFQHDHRELDLVPSIYNMSTLELQSILEDLPNDVLFSVVENYTKVELKNVPINVIIQVIVAHIFTLSSKSQDLLLQTLANMTEKELFDDLIGLNMDQHRLIKQEIPLYGLNLNYRDYCNRVLYHLLDLVIEDIHRHILQVFSRVLFDAAMKMKGRSKYFHQIESVMRLEPSTYEIVSSNKIDTGKILILEMVKPNKYSKHVRIRDHGVHSIRFAEVVQQTDNGFIITSKIDDIEECEDRFNYYITLPPMPKLLRLNSLIQFHVSNSQADDNNIIEDFVHQQTIEQVSQSKESKRRRVNATKETTEKNSNEVNNYIGLRGCTFVKLGKYAPIDLLIEKLISKFPSYRTVIIAPSTVFVNLFQVKSHIRFIRYGICDEILSLKSQLEEAKSKLARVTGYIKIGENIDMGHIYYYEQKIKVEWDIYLRRLEENSSSDLLKRFPFSDTEYSTFSAVVEEYIAIVKNIDFIKKLIPIASSLNSKSFESSKLWNFLYNQFNVVISIDDYVRVYDDSNHDVLRSFENIVVVNSSFETVPIVLQKNPVNSLNLITVLGGEIVSNFDHESYSEVSGVRKLFVDNSVIVNNEPSRPFNPGFKYDGQLVQVEDQVQEAQYCVLLYQYMRLLGYPSSQIVIWVNSLRQKALIDEIVKDKFPHKHSEDTKHSFKFGWPQVAYRQEPYHEFDVSDYAIVSMHNDTTGCTTTNEYRGRLGNYYVTQDVPLFHQLPKNYTLQVHAGENYWLQKRSKMVYPVESTEHMEQYISQMSTARTGGQ
jgi:hypothetical protein